MRGRKPSPEQVRQDFQNGMTVEDMMAEYDRGITSVIKYRRDAGLRGQQASYSDRGGRRGLSRHVHKPMAGPKVPLVMDDAAVEGRTGFPNRVGLHKTVLIDGINSSKIGRIITKGRWKGLPIFTLTLEERATCPTSCKVWDECYGNRMSFARRWQAGPAFEERLMEELADLSVIHRDGFAVRLHVLGDFYSVDYVKLWASALEVITGLHVFGFTARWDDQIGLALRKLARHARFQMRFSGAPTDRMTSVVVSQGENVPEGAIHCPQQSGRTATCGTCALCWQTDRPIAFWAH